MRLFARLIDSLLFTPSRNGKLRVMVDYFARTPDPDRGWALAALTGALDLKSAKPAAIRDLVMERVDGELFGWSYDYVGDLAETVSLIWPDSEEPRDPPRLSSVVETLSRAKKAEVPTLVAGWLDRSAAAERYALLKLMTGGLRVGVSARLAKTALADLGDKDVAEIEELWHGLEAPYEPLFAWLSGIGDKPALNDRAAFRPLMLANPLEDSDLAGLSASDYRAEWKWDGIRVQLVARGGERRIYSRTGDEVTSAFPDIADAMLGMDVVVDGELLVVTDGDVRPFNDLQQRLNRKKVTAKMLREYPAHVRLYDILFDGAEDVRPLPFDNRRHRLETWFGRISPSLMDLSSQVAFESWADLQAIRDGTRAAGIEGLMLKRGDSPYTAGRPKGPWFKWKRDPLTLDTVLMYAQRGHGKRSSFYSDYTFGAWTEDKSRREPVLVPVGKAYFGFTDEELKLLDKFVRANTTQRFGPVREVTPSLVLEVAFDSVHKSTRHKSGVAMRFPRIHRIRWDKPADEADRLETLERMIVG